MTFVFDNSKTLEVDFNKIWFRKKIIISKLLEHFISKILKLESCIVAPPIGNFEGLQNVKCSRGGGSILIILVKLPPATKKVRQNLTDAPFNNTTIQKKSGLMSLHLQAPHLTSATVLC